MIDLTLALKLIDELTYNSQIEEISLGNSLNRVLAEPIIADRAYPPFNRAAMDGITIQTNDFLDNNFSSTIIETIYAGKVAVKERNCKESYRIMTGASVPTSCNAIIPFEKLLWKNESTASFEILPKPFENIAIQGEDLKKNETWLNNNSKITPYLIGILASLGYHQIKTIKPPNILIISCGDELVKINKNPLPFEIRSSGQFVLNAMFRQYGVSSVNYLQIKDNQQVFEKILKNNLDSIDLVVTTGGVSAGDNDFMPETFQVIGFNKIFHKVAIKPGKPVWFGLNKEKNCFAFGLPGNPVSTELGFILFIKNWLNNWFGIIKKEPFLYSLTEQVKKNQKLDLFLPSIITSNNNSTQVKPIKNNGSGDFISPGLMHGFIEIPKGEGFTKENEVFKWHSID